MKKKVKIQQKKTLNCLDFKKRNSISYEDFNLVINYQGVIRK